MFIHKILITTSKILKIMAQIVTKAFDATKKIIRSVFLGSPNLFTTSDVNRQIEAFKYQMDCNSELSGVISDLTLTATNLGYGGYEVIPTFSYLKAKGADFSDISKKALHITGVAKGEVLYLYLVGSQTLVTYNDDPTHEIAGASFDDDTSAASANQKVWTNCSLLLTKSAPDTQEYIALLAEITAQAGSSGEDMTAPLVDYNTLPIDASNRLNNTVKVRSLYLDSSEVALGDSFNQVTNKFRTLFTTINNTLGELSALLNRNRTQSDIFRVDITSTVALGGSGIGCVVVEGANKNYFSYDVYHPNCPYRLSLFYDSTLPRIFAFQDTAPVIENDTKQYSAASPLVHFKEGDITAQIIIYLSQDKYDALYSGGKRYIKWLTNTMDIYGYSITPGVTQYAEMRRVNIFSYDLTKEILNEGSQRHIVLDFNVDFTDTQA